MPYAGKQSFYRQQKLIIAAVVKIWDELSGRLMDEIAEREDNSSIMVLDFSWSHANMRANQGELVLVDW